VCGGGGGKMCTTSRVSLIYAFVVACYILSWSVVHDSFFLYHGQLFVNFSFHGVIAK
jgi:hypothetical protein